MVDVTHVVRDLLDFVLADGVVGRVGLGADVVDLHCQFVHLLLELFLLLGVLCDPLVYLRLEGEDFILVLALGVTDVLPQLAELLLVLALDLFGDLLYWIGCRVL